MPRVVELLVIAKRRAVFSGGRTPFAPIGLDIGGDVMLAVVRAFTFHDVERGGAEWFRAFVGHDHAFEVDRGTWVRADNVEGNSWYSLTVPRLV